jgi:hypothetical protein
MKKFAPALAVIGVILIGVVIFSLMRETAVAPEPVEESVATTTEEVTSNGSGSSAIGIGAPADAGIKKVIKVYANPEWDIRLRYDPEWNLKQSGEVVTIESRSANFIVSKEQVVAKPAGLKSTTKTRTILGQEVEVTRYDNPRDSYAFYEYFTLRVNKVEYYFKISSVIDPNPKVEEFITNLALQQ